MGTKQKKPTRRTKKAVLIVGEGPTEKAFLQYIKELYITRHADVAVKIECGSGGSPRSVIEKTIRLRSSRAYDKCFVLMDKDRPLELNKTIKKRIKEKPCIEILWAAPCIEGLFLSILDNTNPNLSDDCKREFEKNYIPSNKKTDKGSYTGIFTKDVLNQQRKNISELDAILKAMQT